MLKSAFRWVGGILLVGFCAASLMAVLTITKRIAVERPNPSLKQRQGNGKTAVTNLDPRNGEHLWFFNS